MSIVKLIKINRPITVAAWVKASTVFDRSDVGIMSYNPAGGRDVRVLSPFVLSCIDWGLAMHRYPVQGVPTK
jgi:hypothetical protein